MIRSCSFSTSRRTAWTPAGRKEVLELAHDLAHNKGMNLIFSSHILPDVESVCDYVIVLGGGKLLAQGEIRELRQLHDQAFDANSSPCLRSVRRRP